MKHIKTLFSTCGLSLLATGLMMTSCDDQSAHQRSIRNLNTYVQQHKDSVDSYLSTRWEDLDTAYQSRRADIIKDSAKMSRVQLDSFYIIENNWLIYKKEYETKAAEKSQVAEMDNVRKKLTLDGIRLDYADLKADRIEEEYEHFIAAVKANKETLTKEQWLVANVSWKALNGRRKEIKKDIAPADESKITKLKLEYAAIKATNRPEASSENGKDE